MVPIPGPGQNVAVVHTLRPEPGASYDILTRPLRTLERPFHAMERADHASFRGLRVLLDVSLVAPRSRPPTSKSVEYGSEVCGAARQDIRRPQRDLTREFPDREPPFGSDGEILHTRILAVTPSSPVRTETEII